MHTVPTSAIKSEPSSSAIVGRVVTQAEELEGSDVKMSQCTPYQGLSSLSFFALCVSTSINSAFGGFVLVDQSTPILLPAALLRDCVIYCPANALTGQV